MNLIRVKAVRHHDGRIVGWIVQELLDDGPGWRHIALYRPGEHAAAMTRAHLAAPWTLANLRKYRDFLTSWQPTNGRPPR